MGCESFARERCGHVPDSNGRSIFETPELHRALTLLFSQHSQSNDSKPALSP